MKDIRRKCYPMVDLSKFTFNKKILSKVVILCYNQFYSQTLSGLKLGKLSPMSSNAFIYYKDIISYTSFLILQWLGLSLKPSIPPKILQISC